MARGKRRPKPIIATMEIIEKQVEKVKEESAIVFWFKDADCKAENKVVEYLGEY